MFSKGVLRQAEPVSAAVRPPNQLGVGNRELEQREHQKQDKMVEPGMPVSDLVSYEGGPSNLLNDKITDQSNYFSNNSEGHNQSVHEVQQPKGSS